MSDRNYWTTLRQRKISRRTMLGASAKAGVGVAGLALVGCGDDDEPDAGAVAAERAAAAAEEAAAAAVAAGDARAADSEAAAAVAASAADAAADAADAAADAADAAGEASAAASQAASAADAAAALAAEAAESEDAGNAAAAAEAAAAAAAQAADAAGAAGDAAAAAVADAAAQAAEAAAQAARDVAAAVEAGTATAAAAQAAIDNAAEAAAAAAAAAGEASAAAGQAAAAAGEAAATAAATAEAAAETAAAAVAAAQEAADAAGEAAASAAAAVAGGMAEDAEFSVPWPLDQVDLDASVVAAVATDNGGLDQGRSGSLTNFYSHGAVFGSAMQVDPRDNSLMATVATPEWIDPVTIRAAIAPATFHDGSTVTAHDLVFTHERVGGVAEYHDGGATSDHPGGWTTCCGVWGSNNWARSEAVDDRTWEIELLEPDASFLLLHMTTVNTSIFSKADTERRGDTAVDQSPMGTGPYRFVSHTEDEDFVYERFEDHLFPLDHPVRVPHVPHNQQLTVLVRPELQSRLAGLEVGEIDMVAGVGPDIARPFLDDPDFTVQWGPAVLWGIQVIQPNLYAETLDDGSPNPFRDVRVRQAANHAVNRQSLIDNLLLGIGEQSLVAHSVTQGYPTPEQKQEVTYAYDPERARALLAEAGYPDGFDIPLYWTPDFGGAYISDMVLAVAQDLNAVGIRADLRAIPVGEYFTDAYTRGGPDAPPGLYWFWGSPNPDIGHPWECCAGPRGFFGVAVPPEPDMDELFLAQRLEQDPARRLEMITELILEHARRAYYIYIVEPPDGILTRSDVNWPKGGRYGILSFYNTYAVQRHI